MSKKWYNTKYKRKKEVFPTDRKADQWGKPLIFKREGGKMRKNARS